MIKRSYVLNNQRYFLPYGFHLNEDLVPLAEMRDLIKRNDLSKSAKLRLSWMDFYGRTNNVSLTCRHFGISRKTFYAWFKRYNPYCLKSLEEKSKRPLKTRTPLISWAQEQRIIALRKKYLRYSKFKLAVIYQRTYDERISSWQIQRTIQKYHLYWQPAKIRRTQAKRLRATRKKKITELKKEPKQGFLICLDTIVIYWNNLKRYIFTAIDGYSKISFARMYSSKSSKNARDFFQRINYLYQAKIENIQTDNGSEFRGLFETTVNQLCPKVQRYFSRPHTPKDNPVIENFNGVLQKEFIQLGNFTPNVNLFNKNLTEWLIEYNFNRPHQTLNYQTPIEFHFQHQKVLPMCPSSAFS